MYDDITGIILSGGKSSRMGTNKSFLKLGGKTMLEIIIERSKKIFKETILITNDPDIYSKYEISTYTDIYKNFGPIAGLHSGLMNSNTEKNFLLSCDIPFLDEKSIEFIINYFSDSNCIVPKAEGFVQHMCGLYNKSLLPQIESILKDVVKEKKDKKSCKMGSLVKQSDGIIIDFEKEYPDYKSKLFLNINSRDDFEMALKEFE
ncbi:MAG: molybdenum cofactor guanylyltransferase [Leptospiraceae bacterium]|nr:molybdenum cofactor guanylyltransferase [Leptospiraceae bacterium]